MAGDEAISMFSDEKRDCRVPFSGTAMTIRENSPTTQNIYHVRMKVKLCYAYDYGFGH